LTILTRWWSVLRSSPAFGGASALARPYIVSAAATTAEVWLAQGCAKDKECRVAKYPIQQV
jgi:hypothetical protein